MCWPGWVKSRFAAKVGDNVARFIGWAGSVLILVDNFFTKNVFYSGFAYI